MTDKEMKVERYKEENRSVKPGQTVFTGSSLMEMFPINKLLELHGDDTIIITEASEGSYLGNCWRFLTYALLNLRPQRSLSILVLTI